MDKIRGIHVYQAIANNNKSSILSLEISVQLKNINAFPIELGEITILLWWK